MSGVDTPGRIDSLGVFVGGALFMPVRWQIFSVCWCECGPVSHHCAHNGQQKSVFTRYDFSFAGMTPEQVENMTNKWHVYMTKDGRISLAGLSSGKTKYLAEAINDSIRNC